MGFSLKIKKLKQTDLNQLFYLFSTSINQSFPEYSLNIKHSIVTGKKYWSKSNYKRRLVNKNRLILGAFLNNKLIGLLDAEKPFAGVSLGVWLIVKEDYQHQSIGKKLIEAWENYMKKEGAHLLYLYSPHRNKPFYEKIGFELSGEFKKGWFGTNDYIFTKLIQEPIEKNFLKYKSE